MKRIFISFLVAFSFIFSNAYSLSNIGLIHIKQHEDCKLTAYWDSNGYSIGYGHHGRDVKKDQKISQSKADALLKQDVKDAEAAAKRLINALPYKYTFTQSFFDGLVDCIYNCGEGGVKRSEFYKRLKNCRVRNGKMNQSDYDFTIAAVKNLNITCKGHKKRRLAVHKMMSN